MGYSDVELAAVPDGANLGLGCGNPQAIAALKPGETVIDLGSGAGFDCFLAAGQVGETGRVIGIDMTHEMLKKARENAGKIGARNVEFRLGELEHLPVANNTADVILSNCVINLVPDKADGKGRCMDNIFVERLWRSLKYEEVYLRAYATVAEAKSGIGSWLDFYNTERQHQSLGYRTPRQVYQEGLWICGRSALPTGCASPASRANSEGGEMLTFAHIPTGTTVNKPIDTDDSKSRGVAPITAPTMIGADIETGRATP